MDRNTRLTDDEAKEQLTVLHFAIFAIAGVLASGTALWMAGVTWLIQHKILVTAAEHPALVLPHSNGAGLDTARLVIAGCVVLAALAVLVSAVRRTTQIRRYQ